MCATSSWHWIAIAVLNSETSTFWPIPVRSRQKRATMIESASVSAVLASMTEQAEGTGGSEALPFWAA